MLDRLEPYSPTSTKFLKPCSGYEISKVLGRGLRGERGVRILEGFRV